MRTIAAMAAAARYAQNLPQDRLVVVILPDSGSRYLSKVFDDKWMRENGFLDIEWGEVSLQELLEAKADPGLICAPLETPMAEVINQMKEFDISQIPALNEDGSLAGIVTEVCEPSELNERAAQLAAELAGKAPIAVAGILDSVVEGGPKSLEEGLAHEYAALERAITSEDMQEGVMAFLQKREPRFTGK